MSEGGLISSALVQVRTPPACILGRARRARTDYGFFVGEGDAFLVGEGDGPGMSVAAVVP